jgi:hypothetical protein
METSNSVINAVSVLENPQEIGKIKQIVEEFISLKNQRETPQTIQKFNELDERINDLTLVQKYCDQKISSRDLVKKSNPYQSLQETCPSLKSVDFSQAIKLWETLT